MESSQTAARQVVMSCHVASWCRVKHSLTAMSSHMDGRSRPETKIEMEIDWFAVHSQIASCIFDKQCPHYESPTFSSS
jgi:hypothetical protein